MRPQVPEHSSQQKLEETRKRFSLDPPVGARFKDILILAPGKLMWDLWPPDVRENEYLVLFNC